MIKKIKIIVPFIMLFAVASCSFYEDQQRASRGRKLNGKCDIVYAQSIIGKTFDILKIYERPVNYRVIRPGSFQTTDHKSGRVNLELDEAGIIQRVYCK